MRAGGYSSTPGTARTESSQIAELPVALRLRTLASEEGNQLYIAKRGVLPTLVKFLRHDQPSVQIIAAETLRLLASHPDVPAEMVRDPDLVREVRSQILAHRDSFDDQSQQFHRELEAVRSALRPALSPEQQRAGELDLARSDCPPLGAMHQDFQMPRMQHMPSDAQSAYGRSVYEDPRAYPTVLGAYRREAAPRRGGPGKARPRRHLVIHCAALTPEKVDDCEYLLRHIRGVVSYSIVGQNVQIFCSTPTHALHMYLQENGYQPEVREESVPAQTIASQYPESVHAKPVVPKGELRDHTERPRRDKHSKDRSVVSEFFQTLGRHLFS
eukprot:Hpha_TRINITY_DN14630_c0_g1::TRINITY_DN14630_c0_g1_i1::g.48406::m.48406